MTPAQRRALVECSDDYLLHFAEQPIDLSAVFPHANRFSIEIGFGGGEVLLQLASRNPDTGYLGIEVYRPGVGKCLLGLNEMELKNVRVSTSDVRDVLLRQLTPDSLNEVFILFPDPWPKKRHHKRRLISPEFINLCASRMVAGATLCFATDSENYAEHTLSQLTASKEFENIERSGGFYSGEPVRPQTRYERKALARGEKIYDLLFECRSSHLT